MEVLAFQTGAGHSNVQDLQIWNGKIPKTVIFTKVQTLGYSGDDNKIGIGKFTARWDEPIDDNYTPFFYLMWDESYKSNYNCTGLVSDSPLQVEDSTPGGTRYH
uniref:Uncharacterized protein n=1 Tax=Romanomermis culicivorax TaxID=13658 RepID=A0A915LB24_ROMCU